MFAVLLKCYLQCVYNKLTLSLNPRNKKLRITTFFFHSLIYWQLLLKLRAVGALQNTDVLFFIRFVCSRVLNIKVYFIVFESMDGINNNF